MGRNFGMVRSKVKVITISGYAQAGKDLSAQLIKEKMALRGKKVLILHYGDYLKFIAKEYFGWDGKKDEKGRTLLQWLGTDFVRNRYPTFWVDIICNFIKVFIDEYDYFCICDARFPNEISIMKQNFDTLAIHVTRLNFDNGLTEEQKNHPSEKALDGYVFDYEVVSETGKDNLSVEIDKLIAHYRL